MLKTAHSTDFTIHVCICKCAVLVHIPSIVRHQLCIIWSCDGLNLHFCVIYAYVLCLCIQDCIKLMSMVPVLPQPGQLSLGDQWWAVETGSTLFCRWSKMHFEFRLVLVVVCHVDSHKYLRAGSCVDKPGYLLNAEGNRDMVLQSAMVASCLGRTATPSCSISFIISIPYPMWFVLLANVYSYAPSDTQGQLWSCPGRPTDTSSCIMTFLGPSNIV